MAANGHLAAPGEDILHHLYSAGWKQAQWSDVNLYAGHSHYALHRLVLGQSPVLDLMMRHAAQQQPHARSLDLVLQFGPDDEITDEALRFVLSSLYQPRLTLITREGAQSVLRTARFLQLGAIADAAFDICRDAIKEVNNAAEVSTWAAFVDAPIQTQSTSASLISSASSSQDGSLQEHILDGASLRMTSASDEQLAPAEQLRLGHMAVDLRDILLHRLASELPLQLAAFANNTSTTSTSSVAPNNGFVASNASHPTPASQAGSATLVDIYTRLPFAFLKWIIESKLLKASDMEQFAFAKRCISERKRLGFGGDAEETVVLAISGETPQVAIVRKPRRRQLWKAGTKSGAPTR